MASFSGSSTRPTELPENPGLATFFQQDAAAIEQASAAPQSGSLDGFFKQDANPNRSGKPGAGNIAPTRNATSISTATMDAIASQEGLSPTQKRVMGALLGQESGNGQNAATSIDGARGAGQIMPGTFHHFAKPGEVIDNPAHNLAVMARIVKALGAQAGDDPAKMAVGYFSGSGNINPGSGSAWRNDRLDGNGKSVSSYTADVLARLGTSPTEATTTRTSNPTPAKAADPLANAPKWTTVIAKPEYQAMSDSDKAGARQAYFAAFIEPGIASEQKDRYRTWFEAEAAKAEDALKPSMLERIKTGASALIDSSRKLLQPDNPNASVMDGMPVSDPFAGDQHDAGKVGMRQATLNRRATEAQLAAMRQQIAHPPSFASAIDAPASLSSMVGNAKDNLRAAEFGVGKGFATLGKYLALLTAVPSIARDSMVGDEQARTIMFDNVVKPFDEAMRYYEHGNDALPQSVGVKVSNALGDLAATMPAIIATGGGVNPETKYMVDIAKYAFAQGMNREAAMILVRGSADTLGNAMVTMSPAAIPGAFERYQKLTDSGVDPVTASKAAFAEFATTTAMGALPLWKSGGIATRMTTGAAGGAGIAAGSTALQNQVLSDYPGQQQDPFDRDNLIVGGVTGSVLAGLMGHPKQGKVTVTRTGQQNLPPRVEPEFSGTTIDGETGRPVGEPDRHAPRLGERIEPTLDDVAPSAGQSEPARATDTPTTESVKPDTLVTPVTTRTSDQPQLPRPTQAQQTPQRTFTEQEILGYADTRYRQLRTTQDGETVETIDEDGQILEVNRPGTALTPGEAAELAALRQHRGNAQELARLYGFNQAAPPAEPVRPAVPEIVNPLPALAPPDSAPTDSAPMDLHEQRDNAITAYRHAAESGDEAASLAAEQQLTTTREQINAEQVQAAKDLQQKLSTAGGAAASEVANAATQPAVPVLPRPKNEKQARVQREAAKSKLTVLDHPDLQDVEIRRELSFMTDETGWAQIGGKMIREDAMDSTSPVIGRTQWIANHAWYANMPERLNEEDTKDAVGNALAGLPLTAKQKRVVSNMIEIARFNHAEREAWYRQVRDEVGAVDQAEMDRIAAHADRMAGQDLDIPFALDDPRIRLTNHLSDKDIDDLFAIGQPARQQDSRLPENPFPRDAGESPEGTGPPSTSGSAPVFALEGETRSEVSRKAQETEKTKAAARKALAEQEAKAKADGISKEIQQRQAASSEHFELGQSAEDALSGQKDIFAATQSERRAQSVDVAPVPPKPVARTEKQANAFHAKQIPDMTDEDLAQAKAFYPPEHKRTPKIAREIARRALAAKESNKTPPAAPMAATGLPEASETPAPVVHADSLKLGETVAFLDHVANVFHPGDQAVVVGQNKNATLFSRADGGSAWIDHARMNRQQPGAWHVITPAAPKADLSRPELLRELKNRLSNAGVRALAVHEGKLAGQMMGFTVGMSPNDKLLTREWVDRVAGGFESSVLHLEKRAAKQTEKQAEKQAEKAKPATDQPVLAPVSEPVDAPVTAADATSSAAENGATPAANAAKPAQAPTKPTQGSEPEPGKAKPEPEPEPEPKTVDPEPVPGTQLDIGTPAERSPSPLTVVAKPRNFTITDELNFSGQGAKTLFKNNVAAIELLKALDAEQRQAIPAEQSVLARFIGWGGMPQVFNPKDAKWKAEFEQLQTLLTPEEYATAASSTRNAHFTPAPVVTSIWQAVQRMGFTHGAVLEPALGSGNFFGLMPLASRSKSQLLGVEFDHITGSLAKHLYPQASIHAPLGFQDMSLVPDSFDLVIGNPPFGAESLYDKAHADISRFKIHGYFFAKSVKALRPGGVLAMVVSKGLLDANDGQGRAAREWLTQQTRLLGAIRLPNTAFVENANTEVTTDIVFLQKLGSQVEANSEQWQSLGELVDATSGETIAVNRYFVDHPEMMLGEMALASSQFRANEPTLNARPGDDLTALLAQAVQALPVDVIKMGSGGIMAARTAPSKVAKGQKPSLETADSVQSTDAEVRPYGHFMQAGKLYQRMPDANGERMSVAVPLTGRELERMKGMIQLRDVLREQLRLEKDASSSDKAVAANRRALNKAYDAFKAKQGLLHAQANKRLFHEDSDASLLLSLEAKYDKGVSEAVAKTSGQKPREARAEKAAIFSGRVQTPLSTVTKVASAKEAMIASLNELGEISPVFIEKVYGKSMQDTARELGDLAFEDPLTGWQPRDLYLSGNVKDALQVARVAAQKDTRYERNVAALLAVQPPDINPSDIFVKIGSPWVAASDYHDFVQAMFGGKLSGAFIPSIGRWSVMVASGTGTETTSKYGTSRLGAHSIMEALMGNKQVAVYDHVSDGNGGTRAVLNVDATAAAQGKADELAEAFQDWIWHDNARRERLSREYNDKFNTNVTRKYDGSHLSLPGMNPAVELRPHQLNWVFRSLIDGVGLSDHVVGAGKTFALIASAMEMRRLGLAKKPMVTVPNHLVGQWAADILTLYPGANVLAASRKDFVKEKRKLMFSKIATGDWDLVVVAHSSFGRIPVPMETEQAILQEQMKEIVDAIVMAKKDKGAKFTVKDLERTKVRVEERIKMLADRPQDDLLDFADLGVDALFVDEAHEFKNLFFSTALQGVAGLGSPTGSSRAFDMFVKTRYVLGRTGGRNVFFATGTPVANSIAEVFHMQRFLQYDTLRARGIHQFDAWANTFGQATSDWEMNAAGKFVQKTRFRKFANLPELKGLWHEVADTVTRPDLIADAKKQGKRFPLPKVATGRAQNVVTERSDLQAAFIGIPFPKLDKDGQPMVDETTGQPVMEFAPGTIVYRLENWKQAVKNNPKEIPLAITGAARKAGLDYRLIDDQAPDFAGSKVNAAVERIVSIWQANDYRAGTQLVFCDLSVPAKYKGKATAEAAEKGPTFFIKDGEAIEHVAGVAVKLASAPDLGFFSFTKRKLVHIHERSSGQLVASASTKQAAIDQANSRIASIGQAKLMERVSHHTIDAELIEDYLARWEEAKQAKEKTTDSDGDGEGAAKEISLDELLADDGNSFSVYDDIRTKLIARGMPPEQIAFIHDYGTDEKKAALFAAMNAGSVRVLLGSTQKMGAGTNVQAKLVALHHMDAPWRPADLEQREGRIIRQKNSFYEADPDGFEVQIFRYATKQTYDSRMWEIIETKARAIEQFKLDASLREIDDVSSESANAAEMKAGASGNPLILTEIGLRTDLRKLDAQKKSWERSRYDLQKKIDQANHKNGWVHQRNDYYLRLAKHIKGKDGAVLILDGKPVKKPKDLDATKVFTTLMEAGAQNGGRGTVVAHYRGFDVVAALDGAGRSLNLAVSFEGEAAARTGYTLEDKFSVVGLMTRLDNMVDGLTNAIKAGADSVTAFEADAELAKVELKRGFPKADELERVKSEHKAVVAALRAGKTAIEPPEVELNDIANLLESGPLARQEEQKRVATLAKLKSLQQRLEAGKLTAQEFQLGIAQLVNRIQARNDAKVPQARERGSEWITERLMRAKRLQELSAPAVDFALWALQQNPAMADDLAISLKQRTANVAGSYSPFNRLMTLFKGSGNRHTVVHEILHHTERMMPAAVQQAIVNAWQRAWSQAWQASSDPVRAALQDMMLASSGDKSALQRVSKAFKDKVLSYDAHYPLVNASEYWAVNASTLLGKRYAAKDAWIAQARQWLSELLERVKGWLHLDSQTPVLKGLAAVLKGNGQRFSPTMLHKLAQDAADNAADLHDLWSQYRQTKAQQQALIDEFGKPAYSNMDWWDKSIGTQFHKAQKHPHFRKAFNLAVERENAISLTAIRPAELAPAFLPRVDDFKSAVKTLIKGRDTSVQMSLAGDALLSGTLFGPTVLHGKVWSTAELQSQFGMDSQGIMLYQQARAAIDASLDEVAAAEGFAALQMQVPSGLREKVIVDLAKAFDVLKDAIDLQISLITIHLQNLAVTPANLDEIAKTQAKLKNAMQARTTLEAIYTHVANLKKAGYAPLMRFGKNFVSVEQIDPVTKRVAIDKATGKPIVLYFGRYETNGEAEADYYRQQVNFRGVSDVVVKSGPINDERHRLYQGVSAETIALFGQVVGDNTAMNHFYQAVLSERSALKRRLERKSIAGFSHDMPRILANSITSNGRLAAQRYYSRDLMMAIKRIPREKGDIQKEAQRLKEFLDNPQDAGAMASSLAFSWFLGGNIASAAVNATQPMMMTLPYLSQWGAANAAKAMTAAALPAMGKQQITNPQLRIDLKRASQEGKVDSQEIFHLYSVGIQGVAAALTNKLGKLPLLGSKVKMASEDARARLMAFSTLWGMPFAMVEGFNRRLTFIAAWNMANEANMRDPYAFAVKAVDATQGIYNKVNRPNWARSSVGRTVFTFTQFRVMNVELLKRMATMGGEEGKKGAAMYLAILILAAGVAGLPYADDIDDIIDTMGQLLGYDTNMKRNKREWAYTTLGKGFGDVALYGASSHLPLDFGGRLGLGNMVPGTGLGKISGEGNRTREFLELGGPTIGGLGQQLFDAYDAASIGDHGKAAKAMMPSSVKNAAAGLDMAQTGKAYDMKGKEKADVTLVDAMSKGIGFNPSVIANKNRANLPIQQDIALQKVVESNIVELWAQGAAKGDQAMMERAKVRMETWNQKNPDMPVMISANQIMGKARQIMTPTDARLLKNAPREMRSRVAAGLDMER